MNPDSQQNKMVPLKSDNAYEAKLMQAMEIDSKLKLDLKQFSMA